LAAVGQNLVYVGDCPAAAKKQLDNYPEVFDLRGQVVVPGLIDSHAHPVHEGLRRGQLDLRGLSLNEAIAKVGEAVRALPKGAWLRGRGWDQNLWPEKAWPDKLDLDAVSPDNPVVLDRVDKHSIWVNSKALIESDPKVFGPDPEGGEIVRSPDGSPSGVLIGRAMFYVYSKAPHLDGRDLTETIALAESEFLSKGLTTVVDAAMGTEEFEAYARLSESGALKLRVRGYVHPQRWTRWSDLERFDGLYGERLSVDGIKLFSDGSLGSRSAWLLADYADAPGKRGSSSLDDAVLEKAFAFARDKGLQVAIHVIGDAAVAQAVACMSRVLGPYWTDRRWRLEHCQVTTEEDRDRILAMGLIPSIQSVGLMTDLLMAESRLGEERLKRAYAFRDFLDRGGYLINGSDCPVESANPFFGFYAAVSRRDLSGFPAEGFTPRHRLTRYEALASYTVWGAKAAFKEGRIGVLAPGALADFAVLSQDPIACPIESVPKINVLMTVVGGETAYGSL
jgi:predicted amidohydrolase YtcJ